MQCGSSTELLLSCAILSSVLFQVGQIIVRRHPETYNEILSAVNEISKTSWIHVSFMQDYEPEMFIFYF
jgi:hypothetical protein